MSIYKDNMETTTTINNDIKWSLLEDLFDKNYLHKTDKTETKIPKIIHQIWLGSELPEDAKILRDEMMKINKNYEYKLWTDADIADFGLKNNELYHNINNYGAKSDILRYEILERFGGIYIDTDFQCVKSFDDLSYLDFWIGNGHTDIPVIQNSIIASIPNNKHISNIVDGLLNTTIFNDNIPGVMNTTGPYYITKMIYETISIDDNIVVFPTTFFFPFPNKYRHSKDKNLPKEFIHKNTYAIHLWKTTWQK